jgi:ArsR family transcriptional regulator
MYKEVFDLHAKLLKALAHPKRLEIIHLLRDQKVNVTEIQSMLGLPQANLSQHLQILREAGVVTFERKGKEKHYTLTHPNFSKASDLLRDVLIERNAGSTLADELTIKMKELVPLVHDPVCGMRLSPKTASYAKKFQKVTYYFCAEGCLHAFSSHPEQYA